MEKITLTVKETAELLGLSLATVYTLVKTDEIPHTKIKGKILFHRKTLESWLIDGKKEMGKVGDIYDTGKN